MEAVEAKLENGGDASNTVPNGEIKEEVFVLEDGLVVFIYMFDYYNVRDALDVFLAINLCCLERAFRHLEFQRNKDEDDGSLYLMAFGD